MTFAGTWTLKNQEGYDDFMRLFGVPEQYIAMGRSAPVQLVICQDGDCYSVETSSGPAKWTDTFTIGQPAMITGPGKQQIQTVVMKDASNRLVGQYQLGDCCISACREVVDDNTLHDILTTKDVTFKRTFCRS